MSWEEWLWTPSGLAYIARRVRVGSRYIVRELEALDVWLAARAPFNNVK